MDQFENVFKVRRWKHSAENLANRVGMDKIDFLTLRDKILEKENQVMRENEQGLKDYLRASILDTENSVKLEFVTSPISHGWKVKQTKITDKHEDVAAGTSKISAISTTQPKTAEEIIELLQIDIKEWKLSQYWNKEKGEAWHISALITRLKPEERNLLAVLDPLTQIKVKRIKPPKSNQKFVRTASRKVAGILSLQDLHFGKEGKDDIMEVMMRAVQDLMDHTRNFEVEKIYMILGSDTLNMDTFIGTTTSGTPVGNGDSPVNAYLKAFGSLSEAIQMIRLYCKELNVVYIPGNHDRLSSFHLVHALQQAFTDFDDINFESSYQERKVFQYGQNMIGMEHGDKTAKNNPLVFATEFSKIWGSTKYRYLYTGHTHGRKTREVITENEVHGFVTKTIPALTSTDYWHYHNKFTGNTRATQLQLHSSTEGLIAEFTFNLNTNTND